MNTLAILLKKKEIIFFVVILLIGALLRFYRLPETMQFLGDQGRDALIARGVFLDHDPAFIGPGTSVGNIYLGPFYYYFMVFPLMLTYPSPVGPAIAVALLGIVTLALMYILGREIIGKRAAFFAFALYSISPTVIENVRFSWNPNIVPFFSLILIWSLYKIHTTRDQRLWVLAGVCATALFQLHYIALVLLGLAGLFWIFHVYSIRTTKKVFVSMIKFSVIALIIFMFSLIPLIVFDLSHGWMNLRSFLTFFDQSPTAEHHFRPLSDVSGVLNAFVSLFARVGTEFFGVKAPTFASKLMITLMLCYFSLRSFFLSDPKMKSGRLFICIFLLVSICILSLYSSSLFDHYLGFVFPLVFLTLGIILDQMFSSIALIPLAVLLLCGVSYTSWVAYPGWQKLDGNIYAFDRTAEAISSRGLTNGTYNILLYSRTKDLQGMNYRYFLTTKGNPPVSPDDWTSFKRLIIIDEEQRANPIDETQYVIKIWPNRQIVQTFTVMNGPTVYILER